MQVPEKNGKASVSFLVTMMLTQCLLLPGPALSALAPYTPYAAGAVAVTASGLQQAKAQRLQWLSRAQGSVHLSVCLRLPLPRPLPPLPPAALSSSENVLERVAKSHLCPGRRGHHTLLDHG